MLNIALTFFYKKVFTSLNTFTQNRYFSGGEMDNWNISIMLAWITAFQLMPDFCSLPSYSYFIALIQTVAA